MVHPDTWIKRAYDLIGGIVPGGAVAVGFGSVADLFLRVGSSEGCICTPTHLGSVPG